MNHFFLHTGQIAGDTAVITGEDVNHIKNVLRMKPGEELTVCDDSGYELLCRITEIQPDMVKLDVLGETEGRELPVELVLYQGLPKGDKMEMIIQKCVELGVSRIVPVAQSRCVMKLDAKKAASKRERWQKIAESAAKQSKRGIIPEVSEVMNFAQAVKDAQEAGTTTDPDGKPEVRNEGDITRITASGFAGSSDENVMVIAYEDKNGMNELRELFEKIRLYVTRSAESGQPEGAFPGEAEGAGGDRSSYPGSSSVKPMRINIFIGPEGGYAPSEVEAAMAAGAVPVSLGSRILRTETAGMALIAAIMLQVEMYA